MNPSKLLLSMVLALIASSAFAGTYNDTTANNSFATSANLNAFFSNGFNADVGDLSGANTSLAAPWVTVNGHGNGTATTDFFSITTNATGRFIVDMDYTMGHTSNPVGFDPTIHVYNSSFAQIAYNDDGGTTAGAGGSVHHYDSFVQLDNLAAGTYYVQVARCCTTGTIDASRNFTMQVQAQVAAVPEPETYAMMLAGLALVGRTLRRRKAKTAAA